MYSCSTLQHKNIHSLQVTCSHSRERNQKHKHSTHTHACLQQPTFMPISVFSPTSESIDIVYCRSCTHGCYATCTCAYWPAGSLLSVSLNSAVNWAKLTYCMYGSVCSMSAVTLDTCSGALLLYCQPEAKILLEHEHTHTHTHTHSTLPYPKAQL